MHHERRIAITVIILALIGVGIFFLIRHFNKENGIENGADLTTPLELVYDKDAYLEELKNTPSDIEGLTQYDKYKKGLDPENGSDTDMDGISDKEEIEVYGSDPTKYSTAGDLYSDSYKISHNMDVTTPCEYTGDMSFPENQCAEVYLTPNYATDFQANVIDYTGNTMYQLKDADVLKEYFVCFYSGNVSIDLDAAGLSGINPEEITVYTQSFYDDEASISKYEVNGATITVEKTYDPDIPYIVYLVNGKSSLPSVLSFADNKQTEVGTIDPTALTTANTTLSTMENRPVILMKGSAFGKKNLAIYYDDSVPGAEQAVRQMATLAVDIKAKENTPFEEYDNIHVMPTKNIERKIKLYDFFLPSFHFHPTFDDNGMCYMSVKESTFLWMTFDDIVEYCQDIPSFSEALRTPIGVDSENVKLVPDVSYTDFFSFSNFGTNVTPGGVCAGIAHLTAQIFNTGSMDFPQGEFVIRNGAVGTPLYGNTFTNEDMQPGDQVVSFDITKNEENATLMDRGLSDYDRATFVKDHSEKGSTVVNKNLSPAEEEFVNMINFSWAKSNTATQQLFGEKVYQAESNSWDEKDGSLRDHFQSGDIVDAMIRELDAGRMVDLSMIVENQEKKKFGTSVCSGHAVNVIGYERAQTDYGEKADAVVFYVYDSNAPHVLGTLTTQVIRTQDGQPMLIYHYAVPGSKYEAASSGQTASRIVAKDHNLNSLN